MGLQPAGRLEHAAPAAREAVTSTEPTAGLLVTPRGTWMKRSRDHPPWANRAVGSAPAGVPPQFVIAGAHRPIPVVGTQAGSHMRATAGSPDSSTSIGGSRALQATPDTTYRAAAQAITTPPRPGSTAASSSAKLSRCRGR